MPNRFLERLARCLVGLAFFGFGIALFLESHLGVPPWDVFHKGLADKLDVSIGNVIIGVGVLLLLLWIPLRQKPGLGTILNAIEIGLVVNVAKDLLGEPEELWIRGLMLVGGLLVIGFGSALYIGAGLGPGPRDGLMTAFARRGHPLWLVRTVLEFSSLAVGYALGGDVGVGTVLIACSIGPLAHWFLARLHLGVPGADPQPEASLGE